MAEQSVPDSVPAEAVEAAAKIRLKQYDSEYDASHLTWRDFADEVREILSATVPILVAAGRAQAAADIRAYADKIQRESWTPSTGVALAAVADQCAKIAEEAP